MLYDYFTNKPIDFKIKKKCIIIGNSGNILKFTHGEEINKFDTIIRLNDAPLCSFKQFVGNRTDIRICAHNAVTNLNNSLLNNLDVLIVWGVKIHLNKYFKLVSNIKIKYPNLKIYKLTNDFIDYNYILFQKYTGKIRDKSIWLSTGWFAIFFLLLYTKDLTIFGFGFLNNSNCNYHYYDSKYGKQMSLYRNMVVGTGHKFFIEHKIFHYLIKSNILNTI